MNGKHFVIATLISVILLAIAFTPKVSQQGGTYDPWIDLNDDGVIDVYDLEILASLYGSSGTPIDKTALLLDLLARVQALEAKFPVTTDNIDDSAVTTAKLAAGAIPHSSTYSTTTTWIGSTTMIDMPDMSVDITLTRNCILVIMFSAVTRMEATGNLLYVRAMVNGIKANPPTDATILTSSTDWDSHSYTFYCPNVIAGTYTVKIQWSLLVGTILGWVSQRILTVIALPA